jgi:hypothetical protein
MGRMPRVVPAADDENGRKNGSRSHGGIAVDASPIHEFQPGKIVTLRQALLWQPAAGARLVVLLAVMALIVLVALAHIITGTAYEFYVFFAPPVALAAWILGQRPAYGAAIVAVADHRGIHRSGQVQAGQ